MPTSPTVKDPGLDIVNRLISDYYRNCAGIAPDRIVEREFGVGNFDVKISKRHMSFGNERILKEYLSNNAVPYVSSSSAYYRFPEKRPMERKGWIGSELVFDLDVTDMNLQCQSKHGRQWICPTCLDKVRDETIKLIYDFLIPDFGFSEEEMQVNFSGNRGYHVHVKDKDVIMLDAAARKQITDYIAGIGIDFGDIFPTAGMRGEKLVGPRPEDKGWRGKIARSFIKSLNEGINALIGLGIDRPTAARLWKNRALVQMGIANGNWDMVYIKSKASFWRNILDRQAVSQSDRIDSNVTNDPTHLLRLANSIHGGSGLIAKKLHSAKDLHDFDPMKDAIAFRKGFVRISAKTDNPLHMNGQRFGPYGGEIKVPTYVGTYLYLKGMAKITNFI
ncbi:MAG: hypothetical protein M1569_03155 [Candidatus Marsarchaeota archaeon]|nr:hypothetical protein [Candidatus Marsarchaeota archaeon]MCL5413373.1 hypothetical protein [Candidatus Marsarchaeota archaeon]